MAEVVEGLDELLANFMLLIEVGMGEDVTKAALAGGEVLREAMLENAPGPHIVVQVVSLDANFARVGVGPDAAHFYYKYFETGVQAHVIAAVNVKAIFGPSMAHPAFSGVHPGIPARPFMRPAFDGSQAAALAAVGEAFWKEIRDAIV